MSPSMENTTPLARTVKTCGHCWGQDGHSIWKCPFRDIPREEARARTPRGAAILRGRMGAVEVQMRAAFQAFPEAMRLEMLERVALSQLPDEDMASRLRFVFWKAPRAVAAPARPAAPVPKPRPAPPKSPARSPSMEAIDIHGAVIEAIQQDGRLWVVIRAVCEALGIDNKTQQRKLATKPWAVVVMMTTTARDEKSYKTACIDLDSLPMWLATIEPSRVRAELRDRLVMFQREAARVLRDHFLGRARVNPAFPAPPEPAVAPVPAVPARTTRKPRPAPAEPVGELAVLRTAAGDLRGEVDAIFARLGEVTNRLVEGAKASPALTGYRADLDRLTLSLVRGTDVLNRIAQAK